MVVLLINAVACFDVMHQAGFQQHPNEWHFSHGDQLWAWREGESSVIYAEAPISSVTA